MSLKFTVVWAVPQVTGICYEDISAKNMLSIIMCCDIGMNIQGVPKVSLQLKQLMSYPHKICTMHPIVLKVFNHIAFMYLSYPSDN